MSLAAPSGLKPIDSLTGPSRQRLLKKATTLVLPHRFELNAKDERGSYIYLLEGTIEIKSANGQSNRFGCRSERARLPVFTDENMIETAVIQTESRIMKVNRRQYSILHEEQAAVAENCYEVKDVGSVELEADVLKRLFDDYQKDRIPVPSIPEAALRVRQLLENPDLSVTELAQVIEQDPSIAGKLVAASNSALSGGQVAICSVKGALVRMGLKPSCSMITSLAMKELFEFSDPKFRNTAMEVWRHSLQVGATARVLVGMCAKRADPDKAFLIGLLHDIGAVTLLSYFAENHPKAADFMVNGSLHELCAMVSGMVLQKWSMGVEFIEAAENAGKWDVAGADNHYTDLVNLAKQQVSHMHHPGIELPAAEETAAYQSLHPRGDIEEGVIGNLRDHPGIAAVLDALQ